MGLPGRHLMGLSRRLLRLSTNKICRRLETHAASVVPTMRNALCLGVSRVIRRVVTSARLRRSPIVTRVNPILRPLCPGDQRHLPTLKPEEQTQRPQRKHKGLESPAFETVWGSVRSTHSRRFQNSLSSAVLQESFERHRLFVQTKPNIRKTRDHQASK